MVQAEEHPGDALLLARAEEGDFLAFEEVVRRYQRRVYATAMRVVRRHDVADDVTQEAFLRAYQSLSRFDKGRPFGPWICRIAANLAVSHVRSPEAREDPLDESAASAAPAPSGDGPLAQVLGAEARAVLARALDGLPAEQRAVFVLRTFEEMSYKEVADAAGISVGTVMSRLSRARGKLRAALAPYLAPAEAPARQEAG